MKKIDRNKVIDHLIKTWGTNKPCPLCNENSWLVSDTVYEMREFHGGGLTIGAGPITPVIPVTCQYCGNTVLINAIIAGVIEPVKEKKEEKNEQ